MGITLTPLDPIKALYLERGDQRRGRRAGDGGDDADDPQRKVMGKFTIDGWLRWLGWASTAAMAACVGGMVTGWFA